MRDICGERFFPPDKPLSGTLVGHLCTRVPGHAPPHRSGPKVYCGEIYRREDGHRYYCNLDRFHEGLHGREVVTPPPSPKPSRWMRFFGRFM